jgi:hypothetical protein
MKRPLKFVRELLRSHPGWRAEVTGGTHYRLVGPRGQTVYCGTTPSDRRAIYEVRARLRRAERESA